MNVVLFGATGMIGSRVLKELISRGHKVTAVVILRASRMSPA
jgi:putative NADH-flavin reductase